jgi:hypothetical protein
MEGKSKWLSLLWQLLGNSKRIQLIGSAAISQIFLKFCVRVKENHPIRSLKGFLLYELGKKLWNF